MNHQPFDQQDKINQILHELGEPQNEYESLHETLLALNNWQVNVEPQETKNLINYLVNELPQPSTVRNAINARLQSPWQRLLFFFNIARTQVNLLRPAFWLFSLLIVLAGWLATQLSASLSNSLILLLTAPLMAVVGVNYGFQSKICGMDEIEGACPASPLQMALSRLMIILAYDICLLGILSLLLALNTLSYGFAAMILDFMTPLIFVSGFSLALSLKFPMRTSLTAGYFCWLGLIAFTSGFSASILQGATTLLQWVILGIGMVLLALGIFKQKRFPNTL